MKAVCGEVNDGVFISFSASLDIDEKGLKPFTNKKEIVRASTTTQKGFFVATTGDEVFIDHESSVQYKDIMNHCNIHFEENKTFPLVKLCVPIPNKDKYNISEFLIIGHFCFTRIDVVSAKKTIPGETLNRNLQEGKKIEIFNRVFIEKTGEPLVFLDKVDTSIGEIQQFKPKVNLEI
jgi:hypothetical protein